MKLITKELENRFQEIGDQTLSSNPIVVAKFINPRSDQFWYVTSYNRETGICYGYVGGTDLKGWTTFSVHALENLDKRLGFGIERDVYFKEIRFNQLVQDQEQDR